MMTVMPVNTAAMARSDAPVVTAVPTGSNGVESRTAVTDVQHALQLFRTRKDGKKRDDNLKRMIRNILSELDGLTDEIQDDEEEQLLWHPPTAFEISQHFIRARRKYLETYLGVARKPINMTTRLDMHASLNQALIDLEAKGGHDGALRLAIADEITALLANMKRNLEILTRAADKAGKSREEAVASAERLRGRELSASQEIELHELTGLPPGDFDPDAVNNGLLGGLNEALMALNHVRECYRAFATHLSESLATAFGAEVLKSTGFDGKLPEGRVKSVTIDFDIVALRDVRKHGDAIGREYALLRRGFAMEQYLRGAQSMPHRVGNYAHAGKLLNPRRSDDVIEKFL